MVSLEGLGDFFRSGSELQTVVQLGFAVSGLGSSSPESRPRPGLSGVLQPVVYLCRSNSTKGSGAYRYCSFYWYWWLKVLIDTIVLKTVY